MFVKDIFSLNKDFKDFKLIAGKDGLKNEIKSVDIMEVPDGVYWVKSGDFIITTGYSLKKNDTTLENIVQMMVAKGAAALGIKVGRFIDEIPEKILQYAEEHNFPIIYVPLAASYNSIMTPILNKIMGDDNYNFQVIKEMRQELNILIKHNYNVTAIANLLSRYIDCEVYILWENNLNIINENNNLNAINAKRIISDNLPKLYQADYIVEFIENDCKYEIVKVKSINKTLAFLCIELKKDRLLTGTDTEVIKEIIPDIAIYLLSNSNKTNLFYKSLDDFYFSIIDGNYENDELKLREEASYRDVEFNQSRYVWIIDTSIKDLNDFTRFEKKIVSMMQMHDIKFFYKVDNRRITFIVGNIKLNSNIKLMETFYQKVVEDMSKSFKGHSFNIGISKICNSLKYIHYAYEEASFSLKIGKKLKNLNSGVHLYDDYMIYHLLYEISGHPTLSKLYKNTIERMKKYDGENNTDLLKTLEALVENDFSISKTSDKLFIHRNTLYKRVDKINFILDMDVYKSENRLILQIALKINEILDWHGFKYPCFFIVKNKALAGGCIKGSYFVFAFLYRLHTTYPRIV